MQPWCATIVVVHHSTGLLTLNRPAKGEEIFAPFTLPCLVVVFGGANKISSSNNYAHLDPSNLKNIVLSDARNQAEIFAPQIKVGLTAEEGLT